MSWVFDRNVDGSLSSSLTTEAASFLGSDLWSGSLLRQFENLGAGLNLVATVTTA